MIASVASLLVKQTKCLLPTVSLLDYHPEWAISSRDFPGLVAGIELFILLFLQYCDLCALAILQFLYFFLISAFSLELLKFQSTIALSRTED